MNVTALRAACAATLLCALPAAAQAQAYPAKPVRLLVGFAAETEDVVERAAEKRRRKRVDLIVANDVSRPDVGFEVDMNEVTIVGAEARVHVARQPKNRVAAAVLDAVEPLVRTNQSVEPPR